MWIARNALPRWKRWPRLYMRINPVGQVPRPAAGLQAGQAQLERAAGPGGPAHTWGSAPPSAIMKFHPTRMSMQKFALLLAGATLACAQQYSISTVAGGAPPATPAAATSTSIGMPRRTTTDSAGNLYFTAGNAVYKMTSGGTLTVVAGNSRAGFSGDGGPAVNAQLNFPQGLAFDGFGNLYIADSKNNRVRIVTTDGLINTFAGNG